MSHAMQETEEEGSASAAAASSKLMSISSSAVVAPLNLHSEEKKEDATSFLSRHRLGALAKAFSSAGFQSADDVLSLTPRKYEALGVSQIGTQLRLTRVINKTRRENDERRAGLAQRLVAAKVRVRDTEIEFRLPPTSIIDDLHDAVARHTGIPAEAFSLCQGSGESLFSL